MRSCLLLALFAVASAADIARSDVVQDRLVQLQSQYQIPGTIHCVMEMDFVPQTKSMTEMMGSVRKETYEYWMDGAKYRVLELVHPAMQAFDRDVRWDGERFQFLAVDSSELIVSANPNRNMPYNAVPLLLPFQFLSPLGGPNVAKYLTWEQSRSDETRARFSQAKTNEASNSPVVQGEFPGGIDFKGQSYSYSISFGDPTSFLPSMIKAVTTKDVAINQVEITYQPVTCAAGIAYFPNSVKVTGRDEDGTLSWIATTKVTLIEADKEIPPETFTVDPQTVRAVIDDDRRTAPVRHRADDGSVRVPPHPPMPLESVVTTSNDSRRWNLTLLIAGGVLILLGVLVYQAKAAPKSKNHP